MVTRVYELLLSFVFKACGLRFPEIMRKDKAKCSKSQIAGSSDFKSRSPNREHFPQIAVKEAQIALSNRATCDLSPFSNRNKIATRTPSNR